MIKSEVYYPTPRSIESKQMKYIPLNDQIYRYVCACRSKAADPLLDALREETESLGEISRMQISQEQGSLMTLLVALIRAKRALEIGTFTGYSAICLARGLARNGTLISIDESKKWTAMARKYWKAARLDGKIELRLGAAIPILKSLPGDLLFDFVFIDADKTEYDAYYELALPLVRKNGLLLFDNMLWGGRLGSGPVKDPSGRAIDELNHKLAGDRRVESVLLPIADGVQFCRKR